MAKRFMAFFSKGKAIGCRMQPGIRKCKYSAIYCVNLAGDAIFAAGKSGTKGYYLTPETTNNDI